MLCHQQQLLRQPLFAKPNSHAHGRIERRTPDCHDFAQEPWQNQNQAAHRFCELTLQNGLRQTQPDQPHRAE